MTIEIILIQDFPYIYTNINSRTSWEGSSSSVITQEAESVWTIVFICILVGALLLQTLLVIILIRSNNSKALLLKCLITTQLLMIWIIEID